MHPGQQALPATECFRTVGAGELRWLHPQLPLLIRWDHAMGQEQGQGQPTQEHQLHGLLTEALAGPLLPSQQQQAYSPIPPPPPPPLLLPFLPLPSPSFHWSRSLKFPPQCKSASITYSASYISRPLDHLPVSSTS